MGMKPGEKRKWSTIRPSAEHAGTEREPSIEGPKDQRTIGIPILTSWKPKTRRTIACPKGGGVAQLPSKSNFSRLESGRKPVFRMFD